MKNTRLLILIIILSSYSREIVTSVKQEITKTDIPAVVTGKINKSGEMTFYSEGPSRSLNRHYQ